MPDAALPDTTVLTSSFWDPNVREQLVTTCTSSTRPSPVAGRVIYETDTKLYLGYDGSNWVPFASLGGWTTYTPTINQGASANIAKTTSYSKYARFGKTITWNFHLVAAGAGTAGEILEVTLPVQSAAGAITGGSGQFYDASTTTRYTLVAQSSTPTTALFVNDSSGGNPFGVAPSVAVGAGDQFTCSITYEAA